jgi:hypothetical protein
MAQKVIDVAGTSKESFAKGAGTLWQKRQRRFEA